MTLDQARDNIGRRVVYVPRFEMREYGVISGVNDLVVFVHYAGDQQAKATNPEDLEFIS